MPSHDPERAYVQAVLDHRAAKLADVEASMRSELDRLAESWRSGVEQELADHEARMVQMRADQAAWFQNFIHGEAIEPAPSQDVGQGQGASGPGPAPALGPGSGQPSLADMDLASMSMTDYARLRADLGIEPTSMNRLLAREAR